MFEWDYKSQYLKLHMNCEFVKFLNPGYECCTLLTLGFPNLKALMMKTSLQTHVHHRHKRVLTPTKTSNKANLTSLEIFM